MAGRLSEALKRIPSEFPELADAGMLGKMFIGAILPQMIVAADRDEGRTRALLEQITRRLARVLEMDLTERADPPS